LSQFFIGRPIFATVCAILITLAGLISLSRLPIARYPQITPPTIVVNATFPGADAVTVAQSVAAPIEQQVNGVPNMLYMSSKSANDGSYTLTVTFDIGTSQDLAAVQVQNQVAIAQRFLPQEVVRQGVTVTKRQPQIMMMVAIRATDPRYDYLFLSNYASLHVYDAVARVPGVGSAVIFGARDYGMRIWLDPAKMAELAVTTQDVTAAINEQNVVAPAGRIGAEPAPPGQEMQYSVRVQGRLVDVAQYQNIVLRAQPDGTLVRLKDVARIELAASDYSRSSRLDGEPVALVGVYQLPDANALDVAKAVRAAMAEVATTFPPGIEWSVPFDTTRFVDESIHEVKFTLAIAGVLVLLVIFIFLESWRATLVPMLAVPVAVIGAFSLFVALGFSINTLTLFALVLAIGLVVDDAIVVVEAVVEKMDTHGMSPLEATRAAMRDVSSPVVVIAIVLISVFVPVSFLGGLTGQFYRQFALTLSASVLISAFVALSFTPALCVLLLRPTAQTHWRGPLGTFFAAFDRLFTGFRSRYVVQVRGLIAHRAWPLGGFALVMIAAGVLLYTRPAGFLPDEDQGYFLAIATLPPPASLQRSEATIQHFTQQAQPLPGVDHVVAITGLSFLTQVNSSYSASAFLPLKPWGERRAHAATAQGLIETLGARAPSMPEAGFVFLNPPAIPGIGSAGGFEFVFEDRAGGSIEAFDAALRELIGRAGKRPEIGKAFTQFNLGVPQYEYVVDRERAKTLGVPLSDVFSTLQTFLGGTYVNDFNLYGRTFRVTAQAEGAARAKADDVARLHVRSRDGQMVPLSALVTPRATKGPEYVERVNIFRAATINGSAAPGYSSGQAVQAMEEVARDAPAGYGYEWVGTTYQEKKSAGQAPYIFGAALVFVFLVLAALYESWGVPFAVILAIPFAVLGAFVGLALRGMSNDIFAQIGLVMLIGLAAKNAILIVEFAKLAHARGANVIDAALEGARLRLRPILMTSFAFVLGSSPLALATGAGAAARQVIGTTVVFGMLIATLMGIFVIPVFYALIQGYVDRRHPAPQPPPRGAGP
jgi:hydrophobe/amphiphile efflux-1 (HAE1) family protein